MRSLLRVIIPALLCIPLVSNSSFATTTTSFTWQSWRQRAAENGNVAYPGTNNWNASNGTLSFSQLGAQTYVEDFVESTQLLAPEGIRIEWEMQATVGTAYGYVGPYVLLTQSSGTGWNNVGIGAQVFYRWETSGRSGAVLHAGRLGNRAISPDPVVPGINDGTFARHVVTISNGIVTWTANGRTIATKDMGTAPYAPMRLMVGARLYDSSVTQSIQIRNLTVTTAAPQYNGPMNARVSGTISDNAGHAVPISGSAYVDFRSVTSQAGSTSTAVSGSVSMSDATLGSVYVPFTGTYNPATDVFTGTYTDPAGANQKSFTFSRTSSGSWSGRMSGTTATSSGSRSYDLTVDVTAPQSLFNSAVNLSGLRYGGAVNITQPMSIPLSIPEIGINTTANLNIIVTGNWNVQFGPGGSSGTWTISGQSSGTFAGDHPINVTGQITQGPVTIPIPISISVSGAWGGTLSGSTSDNNVHFTGNWTATSGDQSFGGNVDLALPVDMSSGPPTNMTAAFNGAISAQVGTIARSIPMNFSGNAQLTTRRQ